MRWIALAVLLGGCPSPRLTTLVVEGADRSGPRLEVTPEAPCALGTSGPRLLDISVTHLGPDWTVDRTWTVEREGVVVRRVFGAQLSDRLSAQVALAGQETPPLTAGDYRIRVKVRGRSGEQVLEATLTLLNCVSY